MKLPILTMPKDDDILKLSSCEGKDHCKDCQLSVQNGGRCEGCTPKHKAALRGSFQKCYQLCTTCTGFKVDVQGVCCRSPVRDVYMSAVARSLDWNKPTFSFKKRPALRFNTKAIYYVSSGGINTMTAGGRTLVPEDTEVAAVNLSRVWGSNGFYSQDLKDYLHLPTKTKLILLTMTLDNILEKGWTKEFYADPLAYRAVGVDYWMPLQFSAFPHEAKMHQYYQYLRTLYATEHSEAWFASGDHRCTGLNTDDLFLRSVKAIPQIMINTQMTTNQESWLGILRTLKTYHALAPANVAFFLVGAATPSFVHNCRKVCGDRDLYFFSSKVLYLATCGHALKPGGGVAPSSLSKLELFHINQNTFAQMVKNYGSPT